MFAVSGCQRLDLVFIILDITYGQNIKLGSFFFMEERYRRMKLYEIKLGSSFSFPFICNMFVILN